MSEQPFTAGQFADLINRLRGRYAVGPIMANGDPEFGYRQFDTMPDGKCLPAIHGEAADALEKAQSALAEALGALEPFARGYHAAFSGLADEVDVRLDATFALENRRAVCTHKPVSVKVGTLRLASNTHSRLTNGEGGA